MSIDFLKIFNKAVNFIFNKIKTILIAVIILIFSFETSSVILDIVFAEKVIINKSVAGRINVNKIDKNPF